MEIYFNKTCLPKKNFNANAVEIKEAHYKRMGGTCHHEYLIIPKLYICYSVVSTYISRS